MIVHSFEPGVDSFGLDGVVAEIGFAVCGADFARLEPPDRFAEVERALKEKRLLLIWDNFETVFTMPDPAEATPALDETGRNELRAFLQRLAAGGRSAAIVTSRTDEAWLGELRRIELGGLAPHEAIEYADQILAPYPAATPRRAERTFAELLEWLDGHPLSMRLVLPHLQTTEPGALLAALQGAGELPGVVGEDGGRTSSLEACIDYSFEHLSQTTRTLLVAVCLFQGVADTNVLREFSQVPDVPQRFSGFSREIWSEAFDEATGVGLLRMLSTSIYQIHPALPTYLAAQWRSEEADGYENQREAADRALLTAYASLGIWLSQEIQTGEAGFAFALVDRQRRTLAHLLGLALDTGRWEEARAIAGPLNDYFDVRGRYEEARGWVDRARVALEGDGVPPNLDSPAGALWLFYMSAEGKRQTITYRLELAESAYREILDMLQSQPSAAQQQERLSVTYHQLGTVAEQQGRLDDAAGWYHKSLAIEEKLGNRRGMAGCYHQLGRVAQMHGRLDDAEDWYHKTLAISEALGDRPKMAITYYQLGTVAQHRGHLENAEGWYRKTLAIAEVVGDRLLMAGGYHQLGIVAQERGHLDIAEGWYLKSLAIREKLGNQPEIASSFHQLGMAAQQRGHLDDAEDWYRKTLAIEEALGNRPAMASTYGQLGLLAEDHGQDPAALEWTVRCVALFDEFPHPATGPGPMHLARLTAKLGIGALETSWRKVTGQDLPQAARDFVESPEDDR